MRLRSAAREREREGESESCFCFFAFVVFFKDSTFNFLSVLFPPLSFPALLNELETRVK